MAASAKLGYAEPAESLVYTSPSHAGAGCKMKVATPGHTHDSGIQYSDDQDGCEVIREMHECVVCMEDVVKGPMPVNRPIWQCAEGHCYCDACYRIIGGAHAPCATCTTALGSIRNRALESMRIRELDVQV